MPTKRAHIKRAARFRIPASPLSRLTIWAVGTYGIIQGVGILLANPIRFDAPAFATLREMPGAPDTWGISAILFGLAILIGSLGRIWWLKGAGLILMSSWAFVFGAGVLSAMFTHPTAATTGGPTYALIGLWTAILIWVDEGPRHGTSPQPPT
jgi:hypothetical protein